MGEEAKPFVDRRFYSNAAAAETFGVTPGTFARSVAPRSGLTPHRLGDRCVRWSGRELNALVAAAANREKPAPSGAAAVAAANREKPVADRAEAS